MAAAGPGGVPTDGALAEADVDPNAHFEILRRLGHGSFGTVCLARPRSADAHGNRDEVAVKMIPVGTDEDLRLVYAEVETLRALAHPNIVRYLGTYRSMDAVWLAMEFCAGGSVDSLGKALDPTGVAALPEPVIAYVCREVLKGLAYLHKRRIIHRDVKAGNLLLTADGHLKMTDFGTSAHLMNTISKRNSFVGTLYWMAPETIEQKSYDGRADIWSLGVTVLEMAEGHPPRFDQHYARALFAIPKEKAPTLKEPARWSAKMHSFVARCCEKDPAKRPTAEELLKDPFVTDVRCGPADVAALLARAQAAKAREEAASPCSSTDSDLTARYADDARDDDGDGDDDRTAIDLGPPAAAAPTAAARPPNAFDGEESHVRGGAAGGAAGSHRTGAFPADDGPSASAAGHIAYGAIPQLPLLSLESMSIDELSPPEEDGAAARPMTRAQVVAALLGRQADGVSDDPSGFASQMAMGPPPTHTTRALLRAYAYNKEGVYQYQVVPPAMAERCEDAATRIATILKAIYRV